MGPTSEQRFIDLNEVSTRIAIPIPVKGHLHRTHPNSEFCLFFDMERFNRFLESSKPFDECRLKDDYIILQMMQYDATKGMLVEFLKFRNTNVEFTDPTRFDIAPWIPMEKEQPMEGQMVTCYKGRINESGEREFLSVGNAKYYTEDLFMNANEDSEVVYWKPISPPEGFDFM